MKTKALTLLLSSLVVCACTSTEDDTTPENTTTGGNANTVEAGSPTWSEDERYAKPGYSVTVDEIAGSPFLWVFETGSEAHQEFLTSGEPAKSVTLIGRGPGGVTLRGADRDVLEAYASE